MVKKQSENKYDLANLKGVGPVTIEKFNNAGINDMLDLVNRSTVELEELTGMEKETVLNVMSKTRAILVEQNLIAEDFINAEEVVKQRENKGVIKTGSNNLDELFDGGVETQAITEVYGEFGCGKTQFAHTVAVIVQQDKEHGGLEGNVLYLDTEGTFRPERIKAIAIARGFDENKCIKGITVARALNSAHQMSLLEHCGDIIKKNNIKLIVVDSVSSHFRSEYLGRGTLAPRQQNINKFLKLLHRITETYNIAAIITNQVLSNPGQMFGDPTRPVGGNIIGHSSTYRLYFIKSGRKRIARMIDSPSHASKEALFDLGIAGVIDPTEVKKKKEEIEE